MPQCEGLSWMMVRHGAYRISSRWEVAGTRTFVECQSCSLGETCYTMCRYVPSAPAENCTAETHVQGLSRSVAVASLGGQGRRRRGMLLEKASLQLSCAYVDINRLVRLHNTRAPPFIEVKRCLLHFAVRTPIFQHFDDGRSERRGLVARRWEAGRSWSC
jgi:hypothetical protein